MKPDASHANLPYRPEIDGLRALAVLPVILFHAGFKIFGGGFVGVDVFLVISGYLITSIISNDLYAGNFSFINFYERRARRILPALFVVIGACIPFSWTWMLPVETHAFSRSAVAALTFVPNFYFWLTTSYFGVAAERLPLLHTWSLGVEEQFYFIFPLIFWIAWRFRLRFVVILTALLAFISFGLCEWAWRNGNLTANFFLAPMHAWELMLGALLALAWRRGPIYCSLHKVTNELASLLGVAMLVGAVFYFRKTTPMPSVYALLPTFGTCLIIACAGPSTLVYRLLSSRSLVGVGLISYSAYLWHQPLFAFARLRSLHGPTWQLMSGLSLLAILLAYLTWRFVEKPFRNAHLVSRLVLVPIFVGSWIMLMGFGLASELSSGFYWRIPPSDLSLAKLVDRNVQGRYVEERFKKLDADFRTSGNKTKILIIGDSQAQDLVNAIFEASVLLDAEIRTVSIPYRCQIYVGRRDVSIHIEPGYQSQCADTRASNTLQRRVPKADIVILAASWRDWATDLLPETLQNLALSSSQRLFVVGPKGIGEAKIRVLLALPASERVRERLPVAPKVIAMETKLANLVPSGTYVSMHSAVCGTGLECNLFTPEGELISYDGTHLTKAGAAYAGRNLFSASPLAELLFNSQK